MIGGMARSPIAALAFCAACSTTPSEPAARPDRQPIETSMNPSLHELEGTEWVGTGELWLDPAGDRAHRYECRLQVESGAIRYTWQHEGQRHRGEIVLREDGARWSDTWHQAAVVECRRIPGAWGLL